MDDLHGAIRFVESLGEGVADGGDAEHAPTGCQRLPGLVAPGAGVEDDDVVHSSGGVEPFGTARRRAIGLLRRHREQEMLQVLLKELRERYADQIQIDEATLRVALPDALVDT